MRWAALVFVSGCYLSLPDRYASEHPMRTEDAPRASAAMQRECGDIGIASSGVRRAPYVADVRPDALTVVWTTRSSRPETFVLYSPDELDDARRLLPARMPLRGSIDRQLAARADGLSPATVYCYELRDARDATLYGPVAVRTAPGMGDTSPIDLLVLGDSGGGGVYQRAVRDRMIETHADLVLHAGDLAYPSANVARMEARVFEMYAPLMRSIPFLPVIGNHDARLDDGAAFDDVFVLPNERDGARYYAFDWGMLHVAALDTERDLARQARWLDEDLGRSNARWVIVIGHRPLRSSGVHGGDLELARTIAPVIARHRVPLVIAGHDHHYERLRTIDGTTYIVTGGGGHSVRPFMPGRDTVIAEPVLHFVHVRVTRDAIVLRAIDATGAVFDAYRLPDAERGRERVGHAGDALRDAASMLDAAQGLHTSDQVNVVPVDVHGDRRRVEARLGHQRLLHADPQRLLGDGGRRRGARLLDASSRRSARDAQREHYEHPRHRAPRIHR